MVWLMSKDIRTWNIQKIIYNFRSPSVLNKIILLKYFLTGVLYHCFKLIYPYLNGGDQFCECYRCLKMVILAYLHVGFFTIFFIKHALLKRFYLSLKLLQSRTTFKQNGNIMKCLAIKMFAWNFLKLPIQKNIIAILRIVTIEKSELIFLLILYFHVSTLITNTEIFTFIAVLVFKLLSRKVLFIYKKDNINC